MFGWFLQYPQRPVLRLHTSTFRQKCIVGTLCVVTFLREGVWLSIAKMFLIFREIRLYGRMADAHMPIPAIIIAERMPLRGPRGGNSGSTVRPGAILQDRTLCSTAFNRGWIYHSTAARSKAHPPSTLPVGRRRPVSMAPSISC